MTNEDGNAAKSDHQRIAAEVAKSLNFSSPPIEGGTMKTPSPNTKALALRETGQNSNGDAEAQFALVLKDLHKKRQEWAAVEKDLQLARARLEKAHERTDSESVTYSSRRSSEARGQSSHPRIENIDVSLRPKELGRTRALSPKQIGDPTSQQSGESEQQYQADRVLRRLMELERKTTD